ncbi:MFS transporter [Paraburkholderia sacchari]|uniref:MFS transporter n=1 Tax=Paraburkholderia sacchari TaxID=159450 RepID=UPI000542ECD3|nr:MFS transporter [Paraburkholderia sacchari]NLP62597.1 MFS transporter [Paraburkholderia sacchari]
MSTEYEPFKAWRIALLMLAFLMVNFFDKVVIGTLAVPIMNELAISPLQFGIVSSSFFWLFAVGGIAGGFLANRISTRVIALVLALSWSLFQLPLVVSSSMLVFMASRVALGFTEGPAYPVAVHAVYKWFPPSKRILPVSLYVAGGSIGLLAAGVAVPLVTRHWGWRANFIMLCGIGVIWSALWLAFGREGRLDDHPASAAPQARVAYRRLLADRTVLGSMLLQFVSYWGVALGFTWLPVYFQKGLSYDAVASGRYYALVMAAAVPVSLGLSFIAQRLIARGVRSRIARGWYTSGCQLAAGLGYMSLLDGQMPLALRLAILILTFGCTPIAYGLCPALLAEVTPAPQRGAILAIGNSVASLAGMIAPVVMGRLVQGMPGAHGYEAGFALCGALSVVGSLIGAALVHPARTMERLRIAVPAVPAAPNLPGESTETIASAGQG